MLSRCSLHPTPPSLNPLPSCRAITGLVKGGHQDLGRMTRGGVSVVALRSHKRGQNRAPQSCRTITGARGAQKEQPSASSLALGLTSPLVQLSCTRLWSTWALCPRPGRTLRVPSLPAGSPCASSLPVELRSGPPSLRGWYRETGPASRSQAVTYFSIRFSGTSL